MMGLGKTGPTVEARTKVRMAPAIPTGPGPDPPRSVFRHVLPRRNQPYRIVFPGTPDREVSFEGERVEVNGVIVDVIEYIDQADRKQSAPVIVTSDLRKLVFE